MKRYMMTNVTLALVSCLATLAPIGQAPGQKVAAPSPIRPQADQPADAARIDRLIQQLGSDDFAERETAGKALEAIGEAALPALRKAQDNPDLEIRRRIRDLIGVQKQHRSAMRAKAWDKFKKISNINSDTGTPDGQIGGICFKGRVRDEDLAWLQWLDDVEALELAGPQITDAGLVHVKKLSRLRMLDLESTKVTDAGLAHLKELDRLECLLLCGTQVTDAGLVHLKALKRLWFLDIRYTQITDAGLVHLKGLKTLQHLDLFHTQITDRGLDQVKEMRSLAGLNLSHTQVTDAGLAKLKGLKKLEELDLSKTQITDAGLSHLKAIPALERVNLRETKVTKEGKADLKKSRPKLVFIK